MAKEIKTIGVLTSGGDAPGKELREDTQDFFRKKS